MKTRKPYTPLAVASLLMALAGPAAAWNHPVGQGRAFSAATADQHAGAFGAARAIDGYRDGGSRWQANAAATLRLDAGSLQMMQGLYLWTTGSGNRSYWLRVETSADGLTWDMQYRAIPTRRNAASRPVYLPLPRNGTAIRHVRISGYGSDVNNRTRLSEVRWLASGDPISSHPQVHRAHWFNHETAPMMPTVTAANPGPHLYAWSEGPERYLSRIALDAAQAEDARCPNANAQVFYPQSVVIDATGAMPQFMTRTVLPDSTVAYALDWSHVDLSNPGAPGDPFAFRPPEMSAVDADMRIRRGTDGTTAEFDYSWILHCDGAAGDYNYRLAPDYWVYKQAAAGTVDPVVTEGWDDPFAAPVDPGFSIPATVGLPFARVTGTQGKFNEVRDHAMDGFVDVGSRWSNDENGHLIFDTGPGLSAAPPVRGLYLWTHKSNVRHNVVSIDVRADGENWYSVLPPTSLPIVPWQQPVFIPVTAGLGIDIKHVRVNGHGNSVSSWSSIAEVRYSDSITPAGGVLPIDTSAAHALRGRAFAVADDSTVPAGALTTNVVGDTIDGDASALNYFAVNQPYTLELDIGHLEGVSALNLWMHRSSERTSAITVRAYRSRWDFPFGPVQTFNVTVPVSPNHLSTQVALPALTAAGYVEIDFSGNSNNAWNSVAEVSWE